MDKIIWITGASSGIGAALAIEFASTGARLILSARNMTALESVQQQCAFPERVQILQLDLEETAELHLKTNAAWQIFSGIDIIIHSGGISQRGLAIQTELITEQRLMNINFWGSVAISKSILPKMIANGGGQIVCISSLVGKFGTKYRSAYAASKHALHGYFDSLRSEVWKENIQITILCPGFIRTNVSINALNAQGEKQGTMDDAQEKGMSPEIFAKKAVRDILAHREETYIGGKETYGVLLKRFVPRLFSKILRKAKVV